MKNNMIINKVSAIYSKLINPINSSISISTKLSMKIKWKAVMKSQHTPQSDMTTEIDYA